MTATMDVISAPRLRLICLITFLLTTSLVFSADIAPINLHQISSNSAPAIEDNTAITPPSLPQASTSSKTIRKPTQHPLWTELSFNQQQVLAPLEAEWNTLDATRKTKWLAISAKYTSMKPDEQQRIQERMREWVKLTPEQRRIARESYTRTKKLNFNQKSEQWEQYQQLPEEQKKKLAADARTRKPVANLPSPSQAKLKTVPPIKSTPKPILEQSVTPSAVNRSALAPLPHPPTTHIKE